MEHGRKDFTDELPGVACECCGKIDSFSALGKCLDCLGDPGSHQFCMKCGSVIDGDEADQFDGVCVTCAEDVLGLLSARVVDWHNKHTWNRGVA